MPQLDVKLEGKMIYRLVLSMKHQCFYKEGLKEIKKFLPQTVMDEKEGKLIGKLQNDINLLIKEFKKKEKKMYTGALG